MTQTVWDGCYDGSHKELIVRAAFRHPAKMAVGLCLRIFQYGQARGWWQPGDTIIDPFAGILTTGIVGAHLGYPVVGVELEPAFVGLARQNIERNRRLLEAAGRPIPTALQGDSRNLRAIIAGASGAVTRPPFSAPGMNPSGGGQGVRSWYDDKDRAPADDMQGATDGNIASMPQGDHAAVVGAITSPPYGGNEKSDYTHEQRDERRLGKGFTGRGRGSFRCSENYGHSDGQIGDMPTGAITSPPYETTLRNNKHVGIDWDKAGAQPGASITNAYSGSVASPPYADSINSGGNGIDWQKAKRPDRLKPSANRIAQGNDTESGLTYRVDAALTSPPYENSIHDGNGIDPAKLTGNTAGANSQAFADGYGASDGQVGAMSAGTYWSAVAQVYRELHALLRPGGVAAIVVKNYVKQRQIVDLVGQTEQLLVAIGFTHLETVWASLVQESRQISMFGDEHVTKTERKSFFRRLAERKGSPAIDHEDIIFVRETG